MATAVAFCEYKDAKKGKAILFRCFGWKNLCMSPYFLAISISFCARSSELVTPISYEDKTS